MDNAGSPQRLMDLGQHVTSVKFLIRERAGPVHQLFRRRVRRRGHQDPSQPAAQADTHPPEPVNLDEFRSRMY